MLGQLRVIPEWLYYFGGLADKVEGRVIPHDRASVFNYTLREPVGVVGVIIPWNSPVLLTMYTLAPALAAGNTVVIKPSEHASASVIETVRLAEQVGFPPGVINVVTGDGEAGQALVDHPGVARISFTGSDATGKQIAARAASRLAGSTLELGGKSANIVFDDCDLEAAEAGILAGIFGAAGQTCVAGSRALRGGGAVRRAAGAPAAAHERDPPRRPDGREHADGPDRQPAAAGARGAHGRRARRAAGAEVVTGGEHGQVDGFADGLFYRPTILSGVGNDSHIAQEEVFGPVLTVIPFRDEAEAIALANGTRYGLAAGLWTNDVRRAHRVARELQAGTVWINLYRAITYNSPFGGYKASGLGRVNGAEAIEEFLQTKSIWCELSSEVQDPFVLRI